MTSLFNGIPEIDSCENMAEAFKYAYLNNTNVSAPMLSLE